MKRTLLALFALILPSLFDYQVSTLLAQGSLTPPAAPAPTMKTLDQIEARTIINSANTPGDAQALFIISAPGSYYFTGNITGVAGKNGINVSADNVSIDLNGFALAGVASTGNGILISGARTNFKLSNGSVRGWGSDGITGVNGTNSQYQDLRVSSNGQRGLWAGPNSTVLNCAVTGNIVSSGITAGIGSTITACTSDSNGLHGFNVDSGSTLSGCTAYANSGRGISSGDSCTVSNCSVRSNIADGIVTGFDCNINRCTVRRNDGNGIVASTGNTVTECIVSFNGADGIVVDADCLITRNNCRANGRILSGYGIHVTGAGQNRVEDNNATSNSLAGFYLQTAGNILIRNTARANPKSNYVLLNGNTVGPIVVPSDPITNNNPWANFSY